MLPASIQASINKPIIPTDGFNRTSKPDAPVRIPRSPLGCALITTVQNDMSYRSVSSFEKGRLGERIVSEALSRLPPGYHLFNDLILPVRIGSRVTSQIDHVVASEFGCFVVETKKFEGRIVGEENDSQWVQCLGGRSFLFPNPIRQNQHHIAVLQRHVGLPLDFYHSVVVFVGLATLATPGLPPGVLTTIAVGVPDLRRHVESFVQPLLSPRQLKFAVEKLNDLRRSELTLADHVRSLHSRDLTRRLKRMLRFANMFSSCSRPAAHWKKSSATIVHESLPPQF